MKYKYLNKKQNLNVDIFLKEPQKNKTKIINFLNHLTRRLNRSNLNPNLISEYKNIRNLLFNIVDPFVLETERVYLVPYIIPDLFVSKSIALVGNSKKILRTEYGSEIDSHTDVIRFNYAVNRGYEKHVGSKETIRMCIKAVLSGTRYPNHPPGLIKNYKILRTLHNQNILIFYKGEKPIFSNIAKRNKIDLKTVKLNSIRWNRNIFNKMIKEHRIKFSKDPQCGFGMLLLLMDIGIKPNLYGYDLKLGRDNLGYYWNKTIKHRRRSPHHQISIEHRLLNKFNKLKIINVK